MNNPTPLRPRLDTVRNPLEDALNNYGQMERDLHAAQGNVSQLRVENGSLVAEVNMLREALERSESDRIRLQAVSSTLMGQLMAINAVIGDAVKLSIKHGVEAAEEQKPEETEELNRAGAEVREILTRSQQVGGAKVPGNQFS